MGSFNYKLLLCSSAVVAGVVLSYYYFKKRKRLRDAREVFNYIKIRVVTDENTCNEVVAELRRSCQDYRALGFDCEWVTENGKRHPVALIQLSSLDGVCGLFRLSTMKSIPESLKNLLYDETIYKVGVAPIDDVRYLHLDYSELEQATGPTIDLRHMAEACGYQPGGLSALSRRVLRAIMDKSWRVRCSNWQAEELTTVQMSYAAIDAHAAVKIFEHLLKILHKMQSRSKDCWKHIDDHCAYYANNRYKHTTIKVKRDREKEPKGSNEAILLSKKYPHALRSKPLYHNCFLQAPDGELLCTCDNKKALWYVEKGLADLIQEEPMIVKLRFEPAGRSVGDVGKYYQLTKENKCVVCGSTNSYIRKNVVPREYRRNFPEVMKDHASHDVVLLCAPCHQQSNIRDQRVRETLAQMCHAPLAQHAKYNEDAVGKKIKSAANALLHQARKHVLPEARRKELEDIILQHYVEHDEITEQLLEEAIQIQTLYENSDYEAHGLKVVEHFLEREGLLKLEEIWREHFLDSMSPRYLPELWSVKHNEERLRVKWNEGRLSDEQLKSIGLTTLM